MLFWTMVILHIKLISSFLELYIWTWKQFLSIGKQILSCISAPCGCLCLIHRGCCGRRNVNMDKAEILPDLRLTWERLQLDSWVVASWQFKSESTACSVCTTFSLSSSAQCTCSRSSLIVHVSWPKSWTPIRFALADKVGGRFYPAKMCVSISRERLGLRMEDMGTSVWFFLDPFAHQTIDDLWKHATGKTISFAEYCGRVLGGNPVAQHIGAAWGYLSTGSLGSSIFFCS